MTTMGDQTFDLIPPGETARVLGGCLGGGAALALGAVCAAAGAWVPAVAFLGVGGFVLVRSFGLHTWTEGNELVVRGVLRTRRLARARITRFEVVDVPVWSLGVPARGVVAVLDDGSHQRLQATGAFIREPEAPWGDAAEQVARLEAWRHTHP